MPSGNGTNGARRAQAARDVWDKLSPEEKAARVAANKANGHKGGRPRNGDTRIVERRLVDMARKRGIPALVTCVDYWVDVSKGRYKDATHSDRMRATENLANRLGLPARTETVIPKAIPVKLVEIAGWRDGQGQFHDEKPPGWAAGDDDRGTEQPH